MGEVAVPGVRSISADVSGQAGVVGVAQLTPAELGPLLKYHLKYGNVVMGDLDRSGGEASAGAGAGAGEKARAIEVEHVGV